MAKGLDDCVWATCQGKATPPAKASAVLSEVVGFRQDGKLTRLNPGVSRLVQLSGKFYSFPESTYAAMLKDR